MSTKTRIISSRVPWNRQTMQWTMIPFTDKHKHKHNHHHHHRHNHISRQSFSYLATIVVGDRLPMPPTMTKMKGGKASFVSSSNPPSSSDNENKSLNSSNNNNNNNRNNDNASPHQAKTPAPAPSEPSSSLSSSTSESAPAPAPSPSSSTTSSKAEGPSTESADSISSTSNSYMESSSTSSSNHKSHDSTTASTLSSTESTTTSSNDTTTPTSSNNNSNNNNNNYYSTSSLPAWLDHVLELWKTQSGTAEVLKLKQDVSQKSQAFDEASIQVTQARRYLDDCMLTWERTNGQHLQLLQRRNAWTTDDAQQFATLVGKEVETRSQMEQARKELSLAESHLSHCQLEYMNAMRKRYHEEQIWQDTWRVLGTYGTWSLIILNSGVFLLSQVFHYRREAQKMKHLESLVQDNVASQQAFQQSMVEERQAFTEAATATAQQEQQQQEEESNDKHESSSLSSTFGNLGNLFGKSKNEQQQEEDNKGETGENAATDEAKETVSSPSPTTEDDDSQPSTPTAAGRNLNWLLLQPIRQTEWFQSIAKSEVVQVTATKSQALWSTTTQQTKALLDEVHVPSAIFGASLTGLVVLTTMLLVPSNGRR